MNCTDLSTVSFEERQILRVRLSTAKTDRILFSTFLRFFCEGGGFQMSTFFYKVCVTLGPLKKHCDVDHTYKGVFQQGGDSSALALLFFSFVLGLLLLLNIFGLHTCFYRSFSFFFFTIRIATIFCRLRCFYFFYQVRSP